jgi:hypothetical protein
MTLRAHHNVICLAEERRAREQRRAAHMLARLQFVGWRSDVLTPSERRAYFRRVFAHLRPVTGDKR